MPFNDTSNQKLCQSLLSAESEKEVIHILQKAKIWSDPQYWTEFGDNENNFSIIGNQQSNPVAAIVEKLVNSIDAVLMRECYLEGIAPKSSKAPQSIPEALERYFGVKNGNLANITASQRGLLADNIGFIATGRKNTPNYTIFDRGEGQTPEDMPRTLLSLSKSNKLYIPFVQGKFNMGGTGVLQFCGEHNLQLIISRRHPSIPEPNDSSADYWGFTIVRREDPVRGRRSSVFTYLTLKKRILRFRCQKLTLPNPEELDVEPLSLDWGTIIKLYEYEMPGLKRHIRVDFNYKVAVLLPRPGLPMKLLEYRDYADPTYESVMPGLLVRLEEDRADSLEGGFPSDAELKIHGEMLRVAIYAFRRETAASYRPDQEGVIFTINGQTHGILKQGFFNRCGMAYLADSLLVIVECDGISGRTREDLFMNSRDRLRSGELRSAIEENLIELIKNHVGLRELRERRRREEVQNRLANSKPFKDVLRKILTKSKSLTALFVEGTDLSNPFKSQVAGEQMAFIGERFPTYFLLRKNEKDKHSHLKSRFRVQFETDAVNDYFGREDYPGQFTLYVNDQPIYDYVLNLWNGIATATISLPADAKVGESLHYQTWTTDNTRTDPFFNEFIRRVEEETTSTSGKNGERLAPAGAGNDNRQLPSGLTLPNITEVREEDWEKHHFDRHSALRVMNSGDEGYDFYVNMDNLYLKSELKQSKDAEIPLFEARFKIGIVLLSLALLKEANSKDQYLSDVTDQDNGTVEDRIAEIAKAVAPILLPMINELGDLELDSIEESSSTMEEFE